MIDFKLTDDLDICFCSKGDIEYVTTIETAIPCALFLEARDIDATQDFIIQKRDAARGHFGFGDGEGSLLWKLYQSRLSTSVLNEARLFASDSIEFMSDDGLINSSEVTTTTDGKNIVLNVKINKQNLSIERNFTL